MQRLSKENYYLDIAETVLERATCLRRVYGAIIVKHDEIISTGLGILDRDYIGIYAIHVRETYRRRHIASDVVTALMTYGRKRGAEKAYLQVISDNEPAIDLYRSLGFTKLYDYRFLIKEV